MVAISRTGGGQGRAAALLFARGGATVVGYDRKSDGLVETRELAEREGLTLSTEHSQRRQSNGSMRRSVKVAV
jgi:NAD(P)-dependent dehydrogenase (short-subunit alcohol dehydrogenase family)